MKKPHLKIKKAENIKQAVDFLDSIDPGFKDALRADSENDLDGPSDPRTKYHSMMRVYASYFSENWRSYSEKHLTRLGEWLSINILAGGDLENAIFTGFLEPAHQMRINRVLLRYLSTPAKKKAFNLK